MPAGVWQRPEYYAAAGQVAASMRSATKCAAVRDGVGLIDVGTLGKIEVHGPHAAEFLERVYTGRFADMKVGTTRYGADGATSPACIIDDGVIARLGDRALLLHHHDLRLGDRLPRAVAAATRVAPRVRPRQR